MRFKGGNPTLFDRGSRGKPVVRKEAMDDASIMIWNTTVKLGQWLAQVLKALLQAWNLTQGFKASCIDSACICTTNKSSSPSSRLYRRNQVEELVLAGLLHSHSVNGEVGIRQTTVPWLAKLILASLTWMNTSSRLMTLPTLKQHH